MGKLFELQFDEDTIGLAVLECSARITRGGLLTGSHSDDVAAAAVHHLHIRIIVPGKFAHLSADCIQYAGRKALDHRNLGDVIDLGLARTVHIYPVAIDSEAVACGIGIDHCKLVGRDIVLRALHGFLCLCGQHLGVTERRSDAALCRVRFFYPVQDFVRGGRAEALECHEKAQDGDDDFFHFNILFLMNPIFIAFLKRNGSTQ